MVERQRSQQVAGESSASIDAHETIPASTSPSHADRPANAPVDQPTLAPNTTAPHVPRSMLTVEEFVQSLSASGLISIEEVSALQQSFSQLPEPPNVDTVARSLIERKKLTEYQVEMLHKGESSSLVIGKYVVLDKLGAGGMGVVFKAHHRRMKRTVALKVLPPAMISSEQAIQRFHREVEAAAKLTHPNIVGAFDADEEGGMHFLVMEFVDGVNLSRYVQQRGPLPLGHALDMLIQTARGLDHAHKKGVVHRDIKPANLLLDTTGTVKILDMGLARLEVTEEEDADRGELTQSGRVMGTVDYMAPEQALDAKRADHRADIYSLGCTLYFLVTGQGLSPQGSLTKKLIWHQEHPVPRFGERVPGVSPRLESLFQQMLAKTPAGRPDSMNEVLQELEACRREIVGDGPAADMSWSAPTIDQPAPHSASASHDPLSGVLPRGSATVHDQSTWRDTPAVTQAGLAPPPVRRGGSLGRWVAIGAIGLLLLAGGGWAAVSFFPAAAPEALPNPQGSLVVSVDQAGAQISLDSKPVYVSQHGSPLVVESLLGQHEIKVEKEGFELVHRKVTVRPGKTEQLVIKLIPSKPAITNPRERELLKKVFVNGGSAELVTVNGRSTPVLSHLDDLPDEPFTVESINLDGQDVSRQLLGEIRQVAPTLHSLSLRNVLLGDARLNELAGLKQLWILKLSGTGVTDGVADYLMPLEELRDLDLQQTAVGDALVERLSSLVRLENLYLADTKLTDVGLSALERLTSLRHVSLNGTAVTFGGVQALLMRRPQLEIAWHPPESEREMARHLIQQGAAVSINAMRAGPRDGVRDRANLPDDDFVIRAIDFAGQPVTDSDLESLAQLKEVRSLSLDGTGITSTRLEKLKGLAQLEELVLGRLELDEAAVAALRQALPNCRVVWEPTTERPLAEWILARLGRIDIVTPDGDQRMDLAANDQLPDGRFYLQTVRLDGDAALADADLNRLIGLKRLTTLSLAQTAVGDAGVAQLAAASALRDLNLSGTKVTDAGVARLARLGSLQRLDLSGTAITDRSLETIAGLSSLAQLSLADTKVTAAGLIYLSRLKNLTWLSLSGTQVGDTAVDTLADLAALQTLVIDRSQLTDAGLQELQAALPKRQIVGDPPNLERLAARRILELGGAVTVDGRRLTALTELPRGACKVTAADLADSVRVTDRELAALAPCRDLAELNLSGTRITDAALEYLAGASELTSLILNGTQISDNGLLWLKDCGKLEQLGLRDTRVTGTAFAELEDRLPLKRLALGGTRIRDDQLALLKSFTDLVGLDPSYNVFVSDKGLAALADLTKIEDLRLANTRITDASMAQIGKLADLKSLDLSGTKITDTGLGQIAGNRKIEQLVLSNTEISDSATLGRLTTLKLLMLDRTRVPAAQLDSLRASLPRCRILPETRRVEPTEGENPQGSGRPPRPFDQ